MRYISTWSSGNGVFIAVLYKKDIAFRISINGHLLNRRFWSLQDAERYFETQGYQILLPPGN